MAETYKIDQLQELSGVKEFLRFELEIGSISREELIERAREAYARMDESVVISSYGQGGGVTGQISVPPNLLLKAIMQIVREDGSGFRQLGTSPDFSGIRMSV